MFNTAVKTAHAQLLNALDQMSVSPYYAIRKRELIEAQRVILDQEAKIRYLEEVLNGKS